MRHVQARLYEFRIRYNAGPETAALDSYHYYMAETAEDAYRFHIEAMQRLHACAQHLSVERRNPWTYKWEDASEVIDHKPVKIEQDED